MFMASVLVPPATGESISGGNKGKALSGGLAGASEAGKGGAVGSSSGARIERGEGVVVGARAATLKVSRGHICDLLSFCVRNHTYRMKYFVLRNNVVSRFVLFLSALPRSLYVRWDIFCEMGRWDMNGCVYACVVLR